MHLKEYLTTLNDKTFLSIASLYLGKVDMPFRRDEVIDKLIRFFTEERKQLLMEKVSEEESKLISALYIFSTLEKEKLVEVLEHRLLTSFILKSLEKRLIILSDESGMYHLNEDFPYEKVLSDEVLQRKELERDIRLKDTLKAMCSIMIANSFSYTEHKALRLFTALDTAKRFPLLTEKECIELFTLFLERGKEIGLFCNEEGRVQLDKEKILRFFALPSFIISSIIYGNKDTAVFFCLLEAGAAPAIARALSGIDKQTEHEITSNKAYLISKDRPALEDGVISSDYSVYISSTEEPLYLIAEYLLVDQRLTLQITKDSIKMGFDAGFDDKEIIAVLSRISKEVPQIIQDRIHFWKESYDQIRVYDYLYVETNERNARLIESLPLLAIHIVRKVSPTGFLFRRSTESQWRRIMMYSGLEMVGRTEREKSDLVVLPEEPIKEDGLSSWEDYNKLKLNLPSINYEKPRDFSSNLMKLTINEKIKDKTQKEGYLEALKKGYILSESQIIPGKLLISGRKATGFDFQAKLSLLSSLSKDKENIAELTTEDEKILARIDSVERAEDKSTVSITLLDTEEKREILIAKIFLVREITD